MIPHILGWLSVGALAVRGAIYVVKELLRPPPEVPRPSSDYLGLPQRSPRHFEISRDISDISQRHPGASRIYPMTTQAYRVHISSTGTFSQIYLETDQDPPDELS